MEEIYRSPPFDLLGYIAFSVKYSDGSRKTVLEHREVMEATLGRKLRSGEIVHHIDSDRRNNAPENLKLMNQSTHAVLHGKNHTVEMVNLTCLLCGKEFERIARHERHNRNQGKKGPYCGRSCAGTASHM